MTPRRGALVLAALLPACVDVTELDTRADEVAIPGPWVAPAGTRAIAATQHVPVVDPPAVSPQGRCTSSNPFACSCTHPACMRAFPGTNELNAFLLQRYSFLRAGGTYCCRQNSAATSVPKLSVHATGRAIDLMVPTIGGDADNTRGDQVANYLVENAAYIGIQRVIWDRAFWNGVNGFGLLSSASLPHTDHLHIELSVAGANRQTAFFTNGAPGGTCTARCDGTRLINADCTSNDCASNGAPCVAGSPPRCGSPPPPEPAEAARNAGATLASVRTAASPARLTLVSPQRLFDTRTPEASTSLQRSGAGGAITATSSGTYRDWAAVGVPSNATGAWLNVAATGVDGAGYATVFAEGEARPPTSTVNYLATIANANATPVVFGTNRGVTFTTINPAHLIVDTYGAFTPMGSGLLPSGPTRVLDTRGDVALASNTPRAIQLAAPLGASGVVASLTIVAGNAAGFAVAYPCGTNPPPTSSLNFAANGVVTNTIVSALYNGQLCLLSNVEAHAIVDVTGYLSPGTGLSYTALAPQRLLDTRQSTSLYTGRLGARQIVELPIQRMPGMPASATAVVANLTAVGASGPGFVTAFPCGANVPLIASLNFPAESAVGALTVSSLSNGSLCVFASTRTHLIVDVLGVWTGSVAPPVTPPNPGDDGDDVPPEPVDAGTPTPTDAGRPPTDTGRPPTDTGMVRVDTGSAPTDTGPDFPPEDTGTPVEDSGLEDFDAGPPGDATVQSGCACHTQRASSRHGLAALGVLAVALGLRRRRRECAPLHGALCDRSAL